MAFDYTEDPTPFSTHRPWPLPRGAWIMAQRWSNLLFAHWAVSSEALRALVPRPLAIDLFENRGWLTIAPFYLSHLRPRNVPSMPWLSEFPELNVRTYVTLDNKPGVFFFSLDAGSALAVEGARFFYHLPYFRADMSVTEERDGSIAYRSHRAHAGAAAAELRARYRPTGDPRPAPLGSLDNWLTERYCLYAVDRHARVHRAEIHHRPWPLQPAVATFERNTMAVAAGIPVDGPPARVSFSRMLDVVVWAPEVVGTIPTR
jgi:hypothetical protein